MTVLLPSYDVVIPCFDRAHVVADAARSALVQSHPASRVVVVDDGSSDDSRAVIERLGRESPAVLPLFLPRNRGASAARNAGVAACRSEWIGFLDSDDLWTDQAAETLLSAAVREALDVAVGRFARVGSDGGVSPPECGWDGSGIRGALRTGGVVGTSWSIVRREAVHAAGGWDPSFRTCEDWDFFVRVAAAGARFGRVDALVAYYRSVPGARLIEDAASLADGRARVLAHASLSDERVG